MADAKSYIEVVSDGRGAGTHVYLVIKDGEGAELRYKIPNVTSASWHVDARRDAEVQLTLGGVKMRGSIALAASRTTAEDLISELVAARLVNDKEPPMRFIDHAAHCSVSIAGSTLLADCDCDCGARPNIGGPTSEPTGA